ncbi:uncharacterized protein LOC108099492 [Drosophila ficusphila]|uniref:uncharacterized protein LOC108099492 n=1 Tax=Drosophila ficusphila TaxID=30025 RepID=UPI0007E77C64|nr:uncharacterized protein LOC108099492 [Drosophila ficusphila]
MSFQFSAKIVMMRSPNTPLTARCAYLRGRKRIYPHPISELRDPTKNESYVEASDVESGDVGNSTTSEISTASESQVTDNSGIDVNQEFGKKKRYSRRKAHEDPF